jgi:hypothetical protein
MLVSLLLAVVGFAAGVLGALTGIGGRALRRCAI